MADRYLRELQRQWQQTNLFADFQKWIIFASRSGWDPREMTITISNHLVDHVNDWWQTVADEPEDTRWTINVPRSASGHGKNLYIPSTIALERTRSSSYDSPDYSGWTFTGWGIGIRLGFPEMSYRLSFGAF